MTKSSPVLSPYQSEPSILQLLRLAEEQWAYINELQAHEMMMAHVVEFMNMLGSFYDNCKEQEIELPLKQVFTHPTLAGDFRVMPCVINRREIKCVKIIGTNEEQRTIRDKICVGKAMLIDYYDNHIYAMFDVCALSSFRTAAIACLALERSGIQPESVGLIGAGRIGFYTAVILHRWFGIDTVTVHDRDTDNLFRFAALCRQTLPGLRVREMNLSSLCSGSDALFLATTASTPVCNGDNGQHLRFIASVGADADNLSEIDSSLISSHRLISDSRQSMCLGDMKRWYDQGIIDAGDICELEDFDRRKQPAPEQEKILFISTGVAIQDALVCNFIYDVYRRQFVK